MYTCRDAKEEDFTVIAAFPENKTELFYMFPRGAFPLDPNHLLEVSRERFLPTVIESEGAVVGYSCFYGHEEGEKCWLGNFIIHPKSRGKGAATYLLETMMERAGEELRVRELHLVCHNPNTKALLLYTKLGFTPYGVRILKDQDDQPIAGITMMKEL